MNNKKNFRLSKNHNPTNLFTHINQNQGENLNIQENVEEFENMIEDMKEINQYNNGNNRNTIRIELKNRDDRNFGEKEDQISEDK